MAALVFRNNKMGVEATGVSVYVPDNNRARLMYYLNCMCEVLSLENKGYDLDRLTNYQQYYNLSDEDEKVLLALCLLLSPEVMEGKCIFLNEEACGDSQNEFFSIRAANTTFACAESVFVGKVQVAVKEIMCYTRFWIEQNFLQPMIALANKISENEGEQRRPVPTSYNRPAISYNRSPNTPRYNYPTYSISSDEESCCCTIL